MQVQKSEAEFVRYMVALGLVDRRAAIRWADHVVLTTTPVDEWLLDLAQADRVGRHELLSILDRARGTRDDASWKSAFALLHRAVMSHQIEGEQACDALKILPGWDNLPTDVQNAIDWLDEEYFMRHSGDSIDPDLRLRAFLAQYLPWAEHFAEATAALGFTSGPTTPRDR